MDRKPVLVGSKGPNAGRRFVIDEVGLLLGRGESCDVVLDDDSVSREHARVLVYNGGVWVRDTGSRNGVFVNEKRLVRPKQISTGDVMSIGEHAFTVELAGLEGAQDTAGPTEGAPGPSPSEAETVPISRPPLEAGPTQAAGGARPLVLVVAVVALVLAGAVVFLLRSQM